LKSCTVCEAKSIASLLENSHSVTRSGPPSVSDLIIIRFCLHCRTIFAAGLTRFISRYCVAGDTGSPGSIEICHPHCIDHGAARWRESRRQRNVRVVQGSWTRQLVDAREVASRLSHIERVFSCYETSRCDLRIQGYRARVTLNFLAGGNSEKLTDLSIDHLLS
jgi:hypothetical protein